MGIVSRGATHAGPPTFWWVPYVYLLRVQIITGLVLVLLPLVALVPEPSTLLNGLFDVNYGSLRRSALEMMVIAAAAVAASLTLLATSWVTITNAPSRFDATPIRSVAFPIRWSHRFVFGVAALPVIIGAIQHSWSASGVSPWPLVVGAAAGTTGALVLFSWVFHIATRAERAIQRPTARGMPPFCRSFVGWLATKPNIREGYIDETGRIRPGHVSAALIFFVSAILYVAVGIDKFFRVGYAPLVPTLAGALLLALVLCWAAAGLAFFFDRYRVPVLLPLLALPILSSWLPLSDNFYRTEALDPGYSKTPKEVLEVSEAPVIVVAVSGGGIQAAAWAARVLTGLERTARQEFGDLFGRSIRMVSSVSGGGVGAMYFVNQYQNGRLPADLEPVLKQAEASSLDDVAWGFAYPDLVRSFLPVFKIDRGQALEWAWTRDGGVAAPLGRWRDEVSSADRPAMIFNATLVDTGERLLIGTTRIGWDSMLGLQNFEDLYQGSDIQVVTAARLSASFTYVSPATRPDCVPAPKRPCPPYHVVDGAYYDNFGMSTLIEWLNQGLEEGDPRPKRVLVVQIRGARSARDTQPDRWHGWLYQAWAPLETMLNVRTTGQMSHDEEDFDRFRTLWRARGVDVESAVFQFCGERPPFSWHLTGREKQEIDRQWRDIERGGAWQEVRAFLAGTPAPRDVDTAVCP